MVNPGRDGYVDASDVCPNLREALEDWDRCAPLLAQRQKSLDEGRLTPLPFDQAACQSPLPRAFQWLDGSAFIQHIKLVRQARKAPLPDLLTTVPLMYQGGSDTFLAPHEEIPLIDPRFGLDFEGEIAVITDSVPCGISPEEARDHVRLVMIANDVSLRGLIPGELKQGFGFLQSKPSTAFGPIALTLDELGSAWHQGRLHLPLTIHLNGTLFGQAHAGEMHFDFGALIAHAARTRTLSPGTIIGSGTVANEDPTRGSSCLAERRMLEIIHSGQATTPYLKEGDRVTMAVLDEEGLPLFGTIDQTIVSLPSRYRTEIFIEEQP